MGVEFVAELLRWIALDRTADHNKVVYECMYCHERRTFIYSNIFTLWYL